MQRVKYALLLDPIIFRYDQNKSANILKFKVMKKMNILCFGSTLKSGPKMVNGKPTQIFYF